MENEIYECADKLSVVLDGVDSNIVMGALAFTLACSISLDVRNNKNRNLTISEFDQCVAKWKFFESMATTMWRERLDNREIDDDTA